MKYRLLTCAWMLVAASVCHAQPAAPADPLTAAREAYNAIRIFIAGYVWMTGFGNFSYYYKTGDFCIGR